MSATQGGERVREAGARPSGASGRGEAGRLGRAGASAARPGRSGGFWPERGEGRLVGPVKFGGSRPVSVRGLG